MLANPATHIRNVASNAINIPVRRLKNLIGAALEPAGQAAVLEGVYSLANTMAKTQVIPQLEEDFQTAVNSGELTATEAMMQACLDGGADAVIPYLVAKEIAGDVTGDKNLKGRTINGFK